MMPDVPSLQAHRAFLNRYYRSTRHVYDATRKYYLLGRDRVLSNLAAEPWSTLVEIGPGTGRNLAFLANLKPLATLGGVEPCDAMLMHAQRRAPNARLTHGFAESTDYSNLLSQPIDRILFSYSLSMISDREAALDRAVDALAPGGEVIVVDFADLSGLNGIPRAALRLWLEAFHCHPLDAAPLNRRNAQVEYGPGHYYLIARIAAR